MPPADKIRHISKQVDLTRPVNDRAERPETVDGRT